jgi:hypothetical protein
MADRHDTDSDLFGLDYDDTIIIGHIVNVICGAAITWAEPYYEKRALHTSALTGLGWVDELIEGHPDRIRIALGVRLPVFKALLATLRKMGYDDSRHVKLREQLAIFLYTCVTSLTTRHVGERFQRSNGTISK